MRPEGVRRRRAMQASRSGDRANSCSNVISDSSTLRLGTSLFGGFQGPLQWLTAHPRSSSASPSVSMATRKLSLPWPKKRKERVEVQSVCVERRLPLNPLGSRLQSLARTGKSKRFGYPFHDHYSPSRKRAPRASRQEIVCNFFLSLELPRRDLHSSRRQHIETVSDLSHRSRARRRRRRWEPGLPARANECSR